MEIPGRLNGISQAGETLATGKTAPVQGGDTKPATGTPMIDGDDAAISAAGLASAASDLPEVRSEKIAAIQQALADGSYQVSASEVAAKLIDHMLGR